MKSFSFSMAELKPIIEYTQRPLHKFHVPYYPKRKAEPHLLFVKDQGIYLMSGAENRQMKPDGKGCVVAYAKGFGEDADWDAVRDAAGGDDFAIDMPLEWFTKALARGAHRVSVRLGAKSIGLKSFVKGAKHDNGTGNG